MSNEENEEVTQEFHISLRYTAPRRKLFSPTDCGNDEKFFVEVRLGEELIAVCTTRSRDGANDFIASAIREEAFLLQWKDDSEDDGDPDDEDEDLPLAPPGSPALG